MPEKPPKLPTQEELVEWLRRHPRNPGEPFEEWFNRVIRERKEAKARKDAERLQAMMRGPRVRYRYYEPTGPKIVMLVLFAIAMGHRCNAWLLIELKAS